MPSAEHTLVHNFDSWEIGTIPSDLTLFTPDQFAAALKRDGIINPEVALFKFQGPEAPQYGEITRVVPGFAVGYGVGEAIVGPPSNRRTNEVHYLLMQTFFIDDEGNLVTFVYPQRMFTVRGDGAYTPSTAHTFSEVGEDGLPIFTALATGTPSLPGYPGGVEGLFNELTTESIASTGEPTLLYLFSKYGMVTATEIAPMEAALDNSQGVDIDALLNTMPVFRPSWGSLGYGFLKEDN